MTIYEDNPRVRPTGEEAGEFLEPEPEPSDENETEPTDEKMYTTVPLEDKDGARYVLRQQNVGRDNELGGGECGGEWPDPNTPSKAPAPGAA